jgi:lipoprotein NlpD
MILPKMFFSLILAITLSLTGCYTGVVKPSKQTRYYIVQKGDTLYAIAWRYRVNAKSIARWNNLKDPYVIKPGQRLRLGYSRSNKTKSTTKKSSNSAASSSKKSASSSTKLPIAKAPGSWSWPVKGRLISKYSADRNGIDIAANNGTPVKAAASGQVVYAGNGLRGYGNLIIIKHNATYFSAYAHSRKLLVAEGHRVKRGQKIAEVGSTGTNRDKLHFEIRKNGDSVDPLRYLPR